MINMMRHCSKDTSITKADVIRTNDVVLMYGMDRAAVWFFFLNSPKLGITEYGWLLFIGALSKMPQCLHILFLPRAYRRLDQNHAHRSLS